MSSPLVRRFLLLAFLSIFVSTLPVRAQSGLLRFSGEAGALYSAASQPAPPEGTDIAVLEDEERYIFDADGRSVHTRYMVYKVLSQRGAENWDSISLGWEPWHEDRPQIRARVIAPDLAVHELDPKTITDAPAKEEDSSLYSDSRVLRAPLPAIAPGSVVEQELVSTERVPFFGAGMVSVFVAGRVSIPVQHNRLIIEAPASLPLRYIAELLPNLQPQRTESNGIVKLVFEAGASPALDDPDSYLPSEVPALPTIAFSTGASWQQVAEQYGKIVDDHVNGANGVVQSLAAKLTQGKTTRQEKAQAIIDYLGRNIRYTGVEFGEAAIVPHSPADTLLHKYGDCKDKSTLLVALLRAAGIPAHIALLNAGSRMNVPETLPGMGLFDHAIVYAPGEPDLWIDATDRYARIGQLPTADQGRLALIARAGTTALVRTPEFPSTVNLLVESREIFLAENGPARVMETSRPQGSVESEYRSYYADEQDKRVRENLTNYMKSQYLAEKLDTLSRTDPADLNSQFQLVLESRKAKRGVTELDNAVAAIRLESIFGRLPDELQRREDKDEEKTDSAKPRKARTADYQLPQAFVTQWEYRIVPPLGFQAKPLPKDAAISLGPAMLTEKFNTETDGTVHAVLRFDTAKRRLSVSEATEMRNKIAELREGPAILINFEPAAQALLNQGKGREAFQAYRNLIGQHPKEAVHHLQIAKALLESGLGEAARNEARAAVALEPDSALAQRVLGDILQYDLVGRRLRSGSDFPAAIAAYRAAVKLNPEDSETDGNLAILLEYNDEGGRYAPGSRLKEAVVEYRKLGQEKLAELGLPANLAFALFYAGEFDEARKAAATLSSPPKALLVACEAVLNGSQAGIAEANKGSSGETEFKSTVKTAGEMLMNARRYTVAADLLQAGASGDNAANTMGLAAMLRKARPHEELQFGNDPGGVVMRFFLATLAPSVTVEKLNSLVSRNARLVWKNMDSDELDNLLNGGRQLRRRLARTGASPEVTLDILMQAMEPKVEGNDSSGYRVRVQLPSAVRLTMFVVKENGEYRILDSHEKPNSIGLEILDRVAANDLPGATVLLDWIREEQHLGGGDDPLVGDPFPRFWTKGKAGDAAQMKLAAAALLSQTKATARQSLAILEPAWKSAATDAEKTNLALALLTAYANLEDAAQQLTYASALMELYPESDRAFRAKSYALRATGKFDAANDLARQRLKRLPDDLDAARALMANAATRGDYRGAYQLGKDLVASGKAEATDFNSLAWLSLYFEGPGSADADSAIKGAQLSQNNPHILHTLGCVYAELGRTKEAREVLLQAMDLEFLDEPNPDFWYAFGRIAEQYGERNAALANYAKVTKPKREAAIPESSYLLAQNRLKKMQPAAGIAGRAK